jgi:hypothetical protein
MDKITLILNTNEEKCNDSIGTEEFDRFSDDLKGKYVIVRTLSAGVFAGFLEKKAGAEVIMREARRLWRWQTKRSISLSSIAIHGLDENNTRVCEPLPIHWCIAIEVIPVSELAKENIENFATTEMDQ